MNKDYLSIVLLSKLSNRIRVKLSKPLKQAEDIVNKLKERVGVISCRYNANIKSLTINFNSSKIEAEELLICLSILYAKENGFKPVKIVSSLPKREIPILAYYSLGLIAIAGASNLFIQNKLIQDLLNWLAAGTTVLSIVEHVKDDFDNKGSVDPEVVSVMYLLNSIKNGKFVEASAVTWLTTYGRHFLDLNFEGVLLKINKVSNLCTNEAFYNVSTINEQDSNKSMSFIKALVTKYIERQSPATKNNLIFTNNSLSLVQDKLFTGFRDECEKIRFTNRGHRGLCC